jgi:hypothetical protein
VVKHYCIRLVLVIVALQALEMIQLDIKTAFLYGELEEELATTRRLRHSRQIKLGMSPLKTIIWPQTSIAVLAQQV